MNGDFLLNTVLSKMLKNITKAIELKINKANLFINLESVSKGFDCLYEKFLEY